MQDTLIPDLDVDIRASTRPLSVSGESGMSSAGAMSHAHAHPNQLWAPNGSGMQRKSGLPLSLLVPPRPQPASVPPQMGFSTSCFRLVPPRCPPPVFSWPAHYGHPSPMMPQFYRPHEYQQLMTEAGRIPRANYIGMQGRGIDGFPPGVLPGMTQMRAQKQVPLQYHGASQVPMFSPTVPIQRHPGYNMPTSMHEPQLPNFGQQFPQFSHLHPHAVPQLRPQNFNLQPSAQFPPHIFSQAVLPAPTPQLYPQLRPHSPASQLRPHTLLHPKTPMMSPLTPSPQTPSSQFSPAASVSQFRPQAPTTQLRPLTPTHQLGSQVHTTQDVLPRVSPQLCPARSKVMPQLQTTASLRPQTAPPQIATAQSQHGSLPIPQQAPQQDFIELTQDVYSTQQRTITRVSNHAVTSSQILSPPPESQVSSVPMNQQFCSTPLSFGPCGSSCGHTIVRPIPIHSTAPHSNPGFSPAAVRATVPSVPASPFTPTSSKPTPSREDQYKAESVVLTVTATDSESAALATTTTSGSQSRIQHKQTGWAKRAARRRPAKPKTSGRKPRRTKQPAKPAESSDSAPAVASNSGDLEVEEVGENPLEIGEQVIEVVASDLAEMQIYVDFVKHFKSHRKKIGYKLEDIIQQVAIRYGKKISLQYIQDFEDLLLQKESYIPLLEILDMWVKDTAKASGSSDQDIVMLPANSICPHRMWKQKRKQKTCVDINVSLKLEEQFSMKKSPTPAELAKLACSLGVEKDYVRNWFYNRRRKEKCLGKRPAGKEGSVGVKDVPEMIPDIIGMEGLCYDITVEVPSIHPRDVRAPVCAEYTLQN